MQESSVKQDTSPIEDGDIDIGSPSQVLDAIERGDIDHQSVGDRIGAVLEHAHAWATKMVTEAEAEAVRINERAKATARKIVTGAEADAAGIKAEAEAEAQRRIKYAETRLEEIEETAELARQRARTLSRRLAAIVDRLKEADLEIEIPPSGAAIPDLPDDLEEEVHLHSADRSQEQGATVGGGDVRE